MCDSPHPSWYFHSCMPSPPSPTPLPTHTKGVHRCMFCTEEWEGKAKYGHQLHSFLSPMSSPPAPGNFPRKENAARGCIFFAPEHTPSSTWTAAAQGVPISVTPLEMAWGSCQDWSMAGVEEHGLYVDGLASHGSLGS